ncbi:Nuclear envelope pore membrane protein POM 121 [Manis javanica]|nr:Nuclear envelope pore membrane protein POM 121 [Manis javanica]
MCFPLCAGMAVTGSMCCLMVFPEWCAGLQQAAQTHNAPGPWSKEAVLLALNCWKRKKRTVEEEENQTSAAGQEDKRRCHDSSGSGHSAFKPKVANGVPAAFVPEPGPLKRGLSSQSSDGELQENPHLCCELLEGHVRMWHPLKTQLTLWKRRPSASPFSSPASSRSQTPERPENKIREEDGPQGSGSSAPPVDKESQGEQDTTTSPWIGHSITVKEYYQEKQAQSQWLKRIFEDKTGITSARIKTHLGLQPPLGLCSCDPDHQLWDQ